MEPRFTDRQLDIMNVLWDRGDATVREAKEALDDDLAYTSVLTVFQTLEKNGHVRHERDGKAYRYYPTVSREEAGREAVDYVVRRIFDDSVAAMAEAIDERS
ncbi:MAG: BlaI/MecI/CopY family transcriptional regulator [Gemmatimonadota bacterium]